MAQKPLASVVVLGTAPTALYAVRELGKVGIPVYVEKSAKWMSPGLSRYSVILKYETESFSERLEGLVAFAKDQLSTSGIKPMLVPCSDQDIEFICKNIKVLGSFYMISSGLLNGASEKLMCKANLYEYCKEVGIAQPQYNVSTRETLSDLTGEIEYPVLIKPSLIHRVKTQMKGRKLWVARNKNEFREIIAGLPNGDTDWIVQQVILGAESNILLFAGYFGESGKLVSYFVGRKLRQYPIGFGSASLVSSYECASFAKKCETLFTKAKYKGVAAAEFKIDEDSKEINIIEVNPRPSLWFSIANAAGATFVLDMYKDFYGYSLVNTSKSHLGTVSQNVVWRFWLRDMISKFRYLMVRDFLLSKPKIELPASYDKVFAVWDAADKKPFLLGFLSFTVKLVTRFKK